MIELKRTRDVVESLDKIDIPYFTKQFILDFHQLLKDYGCVLFNDGTIDFLYDKVRLVNLFYLLTEDNKEDNNKSHGFDRLVANFAAYNVTTDAREKK